jgi:hypothetical protein
MDGQSERVNQFLEMILRCTVYDSPKNGKAWLSLAEIWYNSSHHTVIRCSPFKALYDYDSDSGMLLPTDNMHTSEVIDMVKERSAQLLLLKENLAKAHNYMKTYPDRNRTYRSFQIGEQVLLKL